MGALGHAAWPIVAVLAGCSLSTEGDPPFGPASTSSSASSGAGGDAATSTGTAGAGATGAVGGAGGESSTTGSGGVGPEDCLDGVDNDKNGLVDCADPVCQPGHECVPEAPAGWQGYYRVLGSAFPAPAVTPCPGGAPPDVYLGGPGGPAQCSGCSCGGLSGVTCSWPTFSWWLNSSSCSGSPDQVLSPGDAQCHVLPFDCGFGSCSNDQRCSIGQGSNPVGQGSCPASGGDASIPPMWGEERHACESASAGGGCDAGQVCVARGEAPYDGAACVFVDGAEGCPGGWPNQLSLYTAGSDSRACNACTCTPSGVDCIGEEFTVFDDQSCGSGGTPPLSVTGSTCASAEAHLDNNAASYRATTPTLTGSCTAGGGGPVGAVTPTGPVTFCCL